MSSDEDAVVNFDLDLDLVEEPSTSDSDTTNHALTALEVHDLQSKIDELQIKNEKFKKSIFYLKPKLRDLSFYIQSYKEASAKVTELEKDIRQAGNSHELEITNFYDTVMTLHDEKVTALKRERRKKAKICELKNEIKTLNKFHAQSKENDKLEAGARDKENNEIISKLEKEIKTLSKVHDRSQAKDKMISAAREKEKNGQIKELENVHAQSKLQIKDCITEVEKLRRDNARLFDLQKENEKLRKENIKMSNFVKDIEIIRKDNVKPLNGNSIGNKAKTEDATMPNDDDSDGESKRSAKMTMKLKGKCKSTPSRQRKQRK